VKRVVLAALLPLACSRPTADLPAGASAAVAASAVAVQEAAPGGGPAGAPVAPLTGEDKRLLAPTCAGCVVGQVLDRAGHPLKDAIVYVKSGPRPSKPAAPRRQTAVDQREKAFSPHVLAVQVGTKVVFNNSDIVLHNVYSRSPVKTEDLGAFGQGQSRQMTLDDPGRVDIFCAIHTNMHAIILVLDTPFFATTDARGYFEIRNMPPGQYGLRTWTEHHQEIDGRADVGARPAIVRTQLP
jgi:plastocyanin